MNEKILTARVLAERSEKWSENLKMIGTKLGMGGRD
jgi:hypothetical protein